MLKCSYYVLDSGSIPEFNTDSYLVRYLLIPQISWKSVQIFTHGDVFPKSHVRVSEIWNLNFRRDGRVGPFIKLLIYHRLRQSRDRYKTLSLCPVIGCARPAAPPTGGWMQLVGDDVIISGCNASSLSHVRRQMRCEGSEWSGEFINCTTTLARPFTTLYHFSCAYFYPRESEGICFHRSWFVCVCVCVCVSVCDHDN